MRQRLLPECSGPAELQPITARGQASQPLGGCSRPQGGGPAAREAASLSGGPFLERDSAASCENKRLSPEGGSGISQPLHSICSSNKNVLVS